MAVPDLCVKWLNFDVIYAWKIRMYLLDCRTNPQYHCCFHHCDNFFLIWFRVHLFISYHFFSLIVLHKLMPSEGVTRLMRFTARSELHAVIRSETIHRNHLSILSSGHPAVVTPA